MPPAVTKVCTWCSVEKSLDEFAKNPTAKHGRRGDCKSCINEKRNVRRDARRKMAYSTEPRTCYKCNKTKPIDKFVKSVDRVDGVRDICKRCNQDLARSRRYNIPPGWYDVMLTKQGGGCAICERPAVGSFKDTLFVDHDHSCCSGDKSCGKCIRGLICGFCNTALGHVGDSIDLLKALINYLDQSGTGQPA